MTKINNALDRLVEILAPFDQGAASYVRGLKKASPQEIADDLSLWGAAGSLMDQGIYGQPREMQRPFEEAAITLGQALKDAGYRSHRMNSWVDTFEQWKNQNI